MTVSDASPAGGTQVVVATGNRHKLAEIAAILAGLPVRLTSMDAFDLPAPVEDGATFADNAAIKARACLKATGLPAIADDSGLEVDALDGAPGVHSARYAGTPADDARNNAKLLAALATVPPGRRTARFVCVAALALPDGRVELAEGHMAGQIVHAPRGVNGFGYDPLFVADAVADGRTNGELAPAEKDAFSHRGAAFRRLRSVIEKELT